MQCCVIRLADELHHSSTIGDGLFAELALHFKKDQIVELTATAGWYHTVAFLIGVAGVVTEPWGAPFPAPAGTARFTATA